ncbi:hypothetical protein LAZ67_3001454 [Cordylochernes scorpioides]|uniref:Histone-lysine N-methyltransferase SETMAR n=1 Tax=Cordylochernes scorpioides TaxID=51811 RepID=A0ABY6K7T3_9ARAC|nr:hypothetical protein LAZ67_3001454 [Cordylochernes scorpioides]
MLEDRRVTVRKLCDLVPDVSKTTIDKILREHLGYSKVCAIWVPKMLTEDHKRQRVYVAQKFLDCHKTDGEEFLDSIVTGDVTWVHYTTPETKEQSKQWNHISSPKPLKFKQTLSAGKLMATVFWDRKGLLLCDFMRLGTTIISDRYCKTLKQLRRAIQNKRRGMLTKGVRFHHDNARPHTARQTTALIEEFEWELVSHPPYSPDVAPSDFHFFPELKKNLGGTQFQDDDELEEAVLGFYVARRQSSSTLGSIKKITKKFQWDLLESRIQGCHSNIRIISKTVKGLIFHIRQHLPMAEFTEVIMSITRDIQRKEKILTDRQQAKMSYWVKKYQFPQSAAFPSNSSNGIVNLSSMPLTEKEERMLALGLHYVPPDKPDIPRIRHAVTQVLRRPYHPVSYTREHRSLILKLKKTSSLVITKADKGNQTVLMDRADYEGKMINILADTSTFTNIPTSAKDAMVKGYKSSLRNLMKAKLITKEQFTQFTERPERNGQSQSLSDNDDPELLKKVITGDETWIYGFDSETTQQASEMRFKNEPRPEKARKAPSKIKVMLTVFFDYQGFVHHAFQQQGSIITADSYLGVLRRLREAIRQKRSELWRSKSWILHHDNAPAHTALKISKFLQDHSTSVFPQPPYSPDLAPCDFFLFGKLKKKLKGRKFQSIEEIKVESKKAMKAIPKTDYQRAQIFEELRMSSGVAVNFKKSCGPWCGSWKHRTDSPLGISWTSESLTVLGCTITTRNTVASQASHLMGLLERAIARWSPFTRGLSLVGRARAANSLVLGSILHHLHGYLPPETTIGRLQARLARFVWGTSRVSWLPGRILARPDSDGGVGLLDIAGQLRLACLKGVQASLRGAANGYSWLVRSRAWLTPPAPDVWHSPRRRRLLSLWEAASSVLELDHRILHPASLKSLRLRDTQHLGAFCQRLLRENASSSYHAEYEAETIVLRGSATPITRLPSQRARRALDSARLQAFPTAELAARWTPTVVVPRSIPWADLRRNCFSGHDADVALRLALHALPHPDHPASRRANCAACGSSDGSLAHRYWSCRAVRPLLREVFASCEVPLDLQAWLFGVGLHPEAVKLTSVAKATIYKYHLGLELGNASQHIDLPTLWERTLAVHRWRSLSRGGRHQ